MPTDEKLADSSAAETTLDPTTVLNSLDSEQYKEWQKSGELPEEPAVTEDSAPSTEETPSGEAPASEPAPASEADKQEPTRKRADGEDRKKELAREIDDLLNRRRTLYQEVEQLETKKPKDDKSAEPSPAKDQKLVAPTLPVLSTWTGSMEDYDKDVAEFPAKLEAYLQARDEEKSKKAEAEQYAKNIADNWTKAVDETVKRHPDYADVAKDMNQRMPRGSFIEQFVFESPIGPELVYHFAKNPGDLDKMIAERSYTRLSIALVNLQNSLTPSEKSTPAPIRRTTNAPRPPAEVSARGTAPADEIAEAVKNGDFSAFERLENAKGRRS